MVEPEGKAKSRIGLIVGIIGYVLILAVFIACLCIAIPKFAGYESYIVVSGSMEPNIPVGSIVYSHETDPALIEEGDVIVFVDPARGPTPITHRVISNDTAAGTLITKGDANEHEDIDPVTYDNVKGKVRFHAPYFGFVASLFTSLLGRVLIALIALEGWLLTEIGRRLQPEE